MIAKERKLKNTKKRKLMKRMSRSEQKGHRKNNKQCQKCIQARIHLFQFFTKVARTDLKINR